MNTQKRNRIVAAVTVNVVLLLVILVAVMIYQIITISVLSNRREELQQEISSIIAEKDSAEDRLGYYLSEGGVYKLWLELISKS